MREIKFRLWCDNKKEWESDNWVITRDGDTVDYGRNMVMNQDNHFIMQYTGLKDSKGIEIYEGDILSCPSDETMQVIYDESYACFAIDNSEGEQCGYLRNYMVGCKYTPCIIGNIYENPELL